MKSDKGIQKWSDDYDKTLTIRRVYFALFCVLCGVMVLEGIALLVLGNPEPTFLTPEIVHTIWGSIGTMALTLVTSMFAEAQHKTAMNGNHNQRNGNGQRETEEHEKQTSAAQAEAAFEDALNEEVEWD